MRIPIIADPWIMTPGDVPGADGTTWITHLAMTITHPAVGTDGGQITGDGGRKSDLTSKWDHSGPAITGQDAAEDTMGTAGSLIITPRVAVPILPAHGAPIENPMITNRQIGANRPPGMTDTVTNTTNVRPLRNPCWTRNPGWRHAPGNDHNTQQGPSTSL
jgi:hypothetical protein